MNTLAQNPTHVAPSIPRPRSPRFSARVIGVGDVGARVIEELIRTGFADVDCVIAHDEPEELAPGPAATVIQLTASHPRAVSGTAADSPGDEWRERIRDRVGDASVVFVLAGLGGKTETHLAPQIAREAKASGAAVLAFVTLPFTCEGSLRRHRAQEGLEQLASVADGVLGLPSQKVAALVGEATPLADSVGVPVKILADMVWSVWRMLARPASFKIDLPDLCALLHGQPDARRIAVAEASGPNRATDAVDRLLAHPLLDGGLALHGAETVLVSVAGGPNVTLTDLNQVMEQICRQCEQAEVILGTAMDETLGDRLVVTVLAVLAGECPAPAGLRAKGEVPDETDAPESRRTAPDNPFLTADAPLRTAARIVPPAPDMTPGQMRQLLNTQQGGGQGSRKLLPRLRQIQLQLEIVSKGRFDKSEPTIHKGEDLDLPTYIRRGVVLN